MNFSDEVLIQILKGLDIRSLLKFKTTCVKYYLLEQDKDLWKSLIYRDYPERSNFYELNTKRDLIGIYKLFRMEDRVFGEDINLYVQCL